jgi:hypothetical protein
MKSLRAFWHWVDNEKPAPDLYGKKALDTLSPLAIEALMAAERLVSVRTGYCWRPSLNLVDPLDMGGLSDEQVASFRPATRDLSLAIAAGLERMHEQVELDCLANHDAEPEPLTFAQDPKACPGCQRQPCYGTTAKCSLDRYMRENPGVALTPKIEPLQNWIPAKLANMPAHTVLGRKTLTEDGLQLLRAADDQERAHAAMFRREYLAEWVSDQQLAAQRSGKQARIKQLRVAMLSGDITVRTDPSLGVNQSIGFDDYVYMGKTRSYVDHGRIEVFTTVTVDELNRFRGLSPRTIVLRGKPEQYDPATLVYLVELFGPMMVEPGCVLHTPESTLGDFGLA